MGPEVQAVIDHLVLPALAALFVAVVTWAAKSLSDLSSNVQSLNIKMAVILEKLDGHEQRIQKLEEKK